ncbi:hypothetical protein J6590_095123 [Homalodisca vitripennis]|nr:hypothetical protein J6590_095123 [Homalodisca vitripennis]
MNRLKLHQHSYTTPKKNALSGKMAAINVALGLLLMMTASFVIECQGSYVCSLTNAAHNLLCRQDCVNMHNKHTGHCENGQCVCQSAPSP